MSRSLNVDEQAKRRQDRVLGLYQEASKNAGIFVEWRHKILLLASTTLALTFAITSFMIKEYVSGYATGLVLIVMAVFFVTFAFLDRRNAMLLQACYNTAMGLESWLLGEVSDIRIKSQRKLEDDKPAPDFVGGIFWAIDDSRQKDAQYSVNRGTYGWVLRRLYFLLSLILFALGGVLIGFTAAGGGLLVHPR